MDGDVQEAVEAAYALADALRARHVREAVEGLTDQKVHALVSDVYHAPTTGHARAALLAALTGEGK